MAGEAYRDVVLNLRLAGDPNNARVAKDAERLIKATESVAIASAEKVSKTKANAAARAAQQESRAAEKAKREEEKRQRDLFNFKSRMNAQWLREYEQAQRKAAQEEAKRIRESEQLAKKRAQTLMRSVMQEQQARERASRAVESAQSRMFELNNQVAEGSVRAAQGLLTMGRSAAILGIAADEDLEKFVRLYAKIDAGFQLAKGGIDIFVGLSKAVRGYKLSLESAAVAQAALNAAQGAGGVAAGGAGAAGRNAAGSVTEGAAGGLAARSGGILGRGALLGGGTVALFTLAVWEVLAGIARAAGQDAWSPANASGKALGNAAGEWWVGDGGNAQREAQLKARRELAEQQNDALRRQAAFDSSVRAARGDFSAALSDIGSESEAVKAEQKRNAIFDEYKESVAALNAAEREEQQRRESGAIHLSAMREVAEARVLESIQAAVAAERDRTKEIEQQVKAAKEKTKAAQEETRAAEAALKAEREKADTAIARFGKLDAAGRAEAARIAEKRASGQALTTADAASLEKLGIGSKAAQEVYTAAGKAAGGEDILRKIGDLDSLDEAKLKVDASRAKAAALYEKENEAIERHTRAIKEAKDSLEEMKRVTDRILRSQADRTGLEYKDPAGKPNAEQEVNGLRDDVAQAGGDAAQAIGVLGREFVLQLNKIRDEGRRNAERVAANQV